LAHPHLSPMLDTTWHALLNGLLNDELNELRQHRQGFLLRVGKHSGAESVTLNGVRDIKILGKQGEPPSYRPETTEKRFASQTKRAESGLLPFGWVWVESCDDSYQHVSRSFRDKLQPHASKVREAQRERLQHLDEARQIRVLAALQVKQQRQQDEAEARQQADAEAARQLALADMLQEWAGKLMALDAKDLRKQLKLAALRGQV